VLTLDLSAITVHGLRAALQDNRDALNLISTDFQQVSGFLLESRTIRWSPLQKI
jgi:hypothetical protein